MSWEKAGPQGESLQPYSEGERGDRDEKGADTFGSVTGQTASSLQDSARGIPF